MCALLLVYAGWQLFRWPAGDRRLIGDVFFYPVGLAASWAAVGASRRCAGQPRLRSAWRLLAVAPILYLAGDIAQTIYESQGPDPFPSFADALYLSFYPLMLWGLLRFPTGRRDLSARVRLMLDLAVVAIGGAMVVTYVVLGPTLRQGGPNALTNAVSIAYPVGDTILLVGLGSVLLRRTAVSSARALQFMVAGLLFFVAADLVYGYIQLHSTYQGGDPVDALWMVAIALFAVAGAAQTPSESTAAVPATKRRTASWAPYVAVVVGFGLLIIDHRDLSLVIAGVLLATLVCVRQFLAQNDLVHMQRLARYQSLHDALTGLPNRRWLIDDLRAALTTTKRDRPRTLAMFDLDGFKIYNDTFGHLAGDQLLVRLGHRLGEVVAPHGRAYRLGGDEFCVLLDADDVPLGQIVAGAAQALSETGTGFSIGASYGMVTIPSEANDVTAALHIADTRMYAKKNGRRASAIMAQTRDVLLGATAEHSASLPEHMLEVGELSRNVARRLGLDAEMVDLTLRAGELHDVGKLAIPDSILSKPASLSDGEWAFVRNHTLIGERVLSAAPALQPVAKLVRSTHERYDGAGYPDGLSGEQIPLPSRIVFACEAFHAMISHRPYSPGMSETDARAELTRCTGSQFDPRVIDALLAEVEHRTRKPSPVWSQQLAECEPALLTITDQSIAQPLPMTFPERIAVITQPQVHVSGPPVAPGVNTTPVRSVPVPIVAGLVMSAALLAVYAVNSIVHFGGGVDAFVNKWVYDLFPICCAALCFAKGLTNRDERWPWLLLGIGMSSWAAGSVYYSLYLIDLNPRPIPAPSDFLWLGFYPPAYAAIVLLLRARIERFRASLGLDGLIAALAIGAMAAAVVFEAVLRSSVHATTSQLLTDLAYPLGDLVLLGMVISGLALSGWKPGRTLALLASGFIAFVVTDSVFLYELSNNTYTSGTIVDLGWSAGPWLIALAAWQPKRRVVVNPASAYVIAVPMAFGALGLGALAVMTQVHRNALAVALAVASMVALMARLGLTFWENMRLLARARNHDALTGALNRRRLLEELQRQLRGASRRGQRCAVLVFDIDHFTLLNELHGHPVGDRVLLAVAETIIESIRPELDLVGRVGGDQFAVVVPGLDDERAHALAERVRARILARPSAGVRLSAGLVIIADTQDLTADDVLLAADSALMDAKDKGGDQVHSFRGQPGASLALLGAIKSALAEDRFVLYSQPMVDISTGQTAYRELLIRMLTDDGELVAPGAFLPTAERFGLITDIDRWVVAKALEHAAGGAPVAVNLSARSIGDPVILDNITTAIDHGLDPALVIFEITETAATTNMNVAREFAQTLVSLGCALALDDYGTGFGTFTYIKNLPAKYLKIDMEFVHGATTSTTDLEVIRSIVAIAHSLGQRTVAEGIENQQSLDLMRDLGVDLAQGFHLGRPAPLPPLPATTRSKTRPPLVAQLQPSLQPEASAD